MSTISGSCRTFGVTGRKCRHADLASINGWRSPLPGPIAARTRAGVETGAMEQLAGKTAVITGAASGMGRAFAERFADAGMNVVLADVEVPRLEEATAAVASRGVDAIAVATDVSDAAAVDRLRDAALERFGRVNVVCNNAGVAGSMAGAEIDLDDWRWVLGVNLWGVINGHRSFLPHLLDHGDGHIVNTASMAGHFPGHSAYSASKWAVVAITEGLHQQLRAEGSTVGVSCLCPGWVATDIGTSDRNRPEWAAPACARRRAGRRAHGDDPRVRARPVAQRDAARRGRRPGARRRRRRALLDLHRHGDGRRARTARPGRARRAGPAGHGYVRP